MHQAMACQMVEASGWLSRRPRTASTISETGRCWAKTRSLRRNEGTAGESQREEPDEARRLCRFDASHRKADGGRNPREGKTGQQKQPGCGNLANGAALRAEADDQANRPHDRDDEQVAREVGDGAGNGVVHCALLTGSIWTQRAENGPLFRHEIKATQRVRLAIPFLQSFSQNSWLALCHKISLTFRK